MSEVAALTDEGRAFQARAAATGKARSPSVERRVDSTNKKAQLSLTNPHDVKVCQKLLQFDMKTSLAEERLAISTKSIHQ